MISDLQLYSGKKRTFYDFKISKENYKKVDFIFRMQRL